MFSATPIILTSIASNKFSKLDLDHHPRSPKPLRAHMVSSPASRSFRNSGICVTKISSLFPTGSRERDGHEAAVFPAAGVQFSNPINEERGKIFCFVKTFFGSSHLNRREIHNFRLHSEL